MKKSHTACTNMLGTLSDKSLWKGYLALFLFLCLLLNLMQALLTEVMNDETYYALFGEQLEWGYFDHPPMVALMTHCSSLLFKGNLSVRFFSTILQVVTIFVVWLIIDDKSADKRRVLLFALISSSMVMLSAYGFVTTPDVPLLLFTSLFLLFYKRFLKEETWVYTLLIALSVAAMIYSKYHAFLIVGLVLLSNLRLLLKSKVWIAMGATFLLLIPLLFWQIGHGFPSLSYHLVSRSTTFQWSYLIEYLPNQLLVFNPISFILFFYCLLSERAKTPFDRALYFLSVGLILFFFSMVFRGHVEPHWTVACSIPMIYILYHRSVKSKKMERIVLTWMPVVIFLMFIVRLTLFVEVLPDSLSFYGKEQYSRSLAQIAGSRPVVFTGSFQKPSNYAYFTKKEAVLLSGIDSRMTQFDLWKREVPLHRKKVFICSSDHPNAKAFRVNESIIKGFECNNFQSVNRIEIDYTHPKRAVTVGERMEVDLELFNPYPYVIDFNHIELPVSLQVAYCKENEITMVDCVLDHPIQEIFSNQRIQRRADLIVPDLPPGKYQMTFTLYNQLCPAINAPFSTIHIVK